MYRATKKFQTLSQQLDSHVLLQCRNNKVSQNLKRNYDTGITPKKSGIGKPLLYSVITTAALTGGVIAYAKYDKKFRNELNKYVPGSDAFIRFVCQEESTYSDSVRNSITNTSDNVKSSIYKLVGKGENTEESEPAVAIPPSLVRTVKPTPEPPEPKKETPVISSIKSSEKIPVVTESGKVDLKKTPPKSEKKDDYRKYNMSELEEDAVKAVKQAIVALNGAIENLKEYREEVAVLIEKSVQKEDHNIWFKIKEKSQWKDNVIERAENIGNVAMEKIEHLRLIVADPKTDLDPNVRSQIEESMKNAVNDFIYTKALFSQERSNSSVAEKYSKKVEEARNTLTKELGLLFPSILVDSETIVTDEDLDLFVLYTCQLLTFYQKELKKLETLTKSKVDRIIEQSKIGSPEVLKEMLDLEVDKLKREFAQEMLKKELSLKAECETELKAQLKRQTEVHADFLEEVIELKNRELERLMNLSVNEKVEDMRINYNRQLARIIGRMKGLDIALKEKAIAEKQAKRSQMLWNACQSLILAVKSGTNTKPWEEQLKPLENEIIAISKAAAEEDELVDAVIASIPNEAISRGVYSELALKDRFLNVEKVAYRLANLPDGVASLPKIFLSYLQSFLLIRLAKPIPIDELANEPFNASSLDNYDLLCRARYWVDRGDFEQSLKYMNLLKGAARAIANEWMNETRIFLETQQAANVLLSHAVYSSFIYLQNSS